MLYILYFILWIFLFFKYTQVVENTISVVEFEKVYSKYKTLSSEGDDSSIIITEEKRALLTTFFDAWDSGDVTIGIKSFGRVRDLRRLLTSIKKFYPQTRIVVVDDGRVDLKQELEPHLQVNVEIFQLPFDSGVAVGRNVLVQQVKTNYFVYVDDDFEFIDSTSIPNLVSIMERSDLDIAAGLVEDRANYIGFVFIRNGTALQQNRIPLGITQGCQLFHIIPNFFIAKIHRLRTVSWDEHFKMGEHEDFYHRIHDKLSIATCPYAYIKHVPDRSWEELPETRLNEYGKFRRRAFQYMIDFQIKNDYDKYLTTSNYLISEVNYDFRNLSSELHKTIEENLVTFTIINWKRTSNIKKQICHIIENINFVREIIIWNNNPEVPLSKSTFSCFRPKKTIKYLIDPGEDQLIEREKKNQPGVIFLHLINSKQNLNTEGRYQGCLRGSNPVCAFIDDDFVPLHFPEMYANYLRNPTLLHTCTNAKVIWNNLRWSFVQKDIGLFTGFSWVGSGAIVSKTNVANFIKQMDSVNLSKENRALADNFFSFWLNRLPYQIQVSLSIDGLDQSNPYSSSLEVLDNLHETRKEAIKILVEQLTLKNPLFEIPKRGNDVGSPLDVHYMAKAVGNNNQIFLTNIENFILEEQEASQNAYEDFDRAIWYQEDQEILNFTKRIHYLSHLEGANSIDLFHFSSYRNAIDGDYSSAWESWRDIEAGDWFGVDYIKIEYLESIEIMTSSFPGWPSLDVSIDGKHWSSLTERIYITTKTTYSEEFPDIDHQHTIFKLKNPNQKIAFRMIRIRFGSSISKNFIYSKPKFIPSIKPAYLHQPPNDTYSLPYLFPFSSPFSSENIFASNKPSPLKLKVFEVVTKSSIHPPFQENQISNYLGAFLTLVLFVIVLFFIVHMK